MLKVLTSAGLVLLTLKSIGQIDTKTQYNPNKDSLVTIPKQVAVWMIQDIEKAQSYAEEIKLLNSNIEYKTDIIQKQDTIISIQKSKIQLKNQEIDNYLDIVNEQELQIRNLNKSVAKQTKRKRFWRATAFIGSALIGLAVHYHWKNGEPWKD